MKKLDDKSIGEHEHLIHLQVFHFINSKAKSLSDYFLWFYTLVLAFNALCPWLWLSLYIGWRQSQVLLLSLAPAPSLSKKLAWEQQKGFKTDNILLYFSFQSSAARFQNKIFLSFSFLSAAKELGLRLPVCIIQTLDCCRRRGLSSKWCATTDNCWLK